MRKRGRLDRSALAQFGIPLGPIPGSAAPIQEDPANETFDEQKHDPEGEDGVTTRNEGMKGKRMSQGSSMVT